MDEPLTRRSALLDRWIETGVWPPYPEPPGGWTPPRLYEAIAAEVDAARATAPAGEKHPGSDAAYGEFGKLVRAAAPDPVAGLREAAGAVGYAIEKLPRSGSRMTQAAERRVNEAMAMLDAALLDSNRPDGLDAAWAEAEAALPEGAYLWLHRVASGAYYVSAFRNDQPIVARLSTVSAEGTAPATALRALAARLRGDSDGGEIENENAR